MISSVALLEVAAVLAMPALVLPHSLVVVAAVPNNLVVVTPNPSLARELTPVLLPRTLTSASSLAHS